MSVRNSKANSTQYVSSSPAGAGLKPRVKTSQIKATFSANLVNPIAKLFPSPSEKEAGHYLMAARDAKGEKIPTGETTKDGKPMYKYVPALDAKGNEIKVDPKGRPLTIDIRKIDPDNMTDFESTFENRIKVDISLPNKDKNDNTRKRNITVPFAYLTSNEKASAYTLTLYDSAYEKGIAVNQPHDPYIEVNNEKIAVPVETREYTSKAGVTSMKKMTPVGYNGDEPVWDDGTTIIVKAGSDKAKAMKAQGVEFKTYETAVKYEYSQVKTPIFEIKKSLESYKNDGAGAEVEVETTAPTKEAEDQLGD